MKARVLKTRFWGAFLLGAATAATGMLIGWGLSAPPPAYAQIPDSGAQRNEMIKEQRATNQKLAEIAELLREIRDLQKGASAVKPGKRTEPVRP